MTECRYGGDKLNKVFPAVIADLQQFLFDRAAQGEVDLTARFPEAEEAFFIMNYYRSLEDKTENTSAVFPYALQFGETEAGGVCVRVWYQDQVYYADADFVETLLDLMEQYQDVEEEEKTEEKE